MTTPGKSRTEPRPAGPLPGHVSWSDGGVVVRDERLFGAGADRLLREFLGRAFRVDEVGSVEVDRSRSTAVVRPARAPVEPASFLARLASALRDGGGPGRAQAPALPRGVRETAFTVFRHGEMLTTCDVVVDEPGRLRIRHRSLRTDPVQARSARDSLAAVPGVTRTALDVRTGALTLRYDRSAVAAARLIRLAEEVLGETGWWDRAVTPPPHTAFALANTNLAVGAAADLAVTALAPVSALLLVGTNVRTFRLAWRQVRLRKPGLPVLYTVIVGGTLLSGQFLASALMSWTFKFWGDRLRNDLTSERRRLLSECLPVPRLARLLTPAGEVVGLVERLRPGDRVLVGPGDRVPADGRVTLGEGVLHERPLRGREGASRVRPGDGVLAGSAVLHGTLAVEIGGTAEEARANRIGQDILAATSPAPGLSSPTRRAERYAERAVLPTMAAAGVGLLAGDLATAAAILRPDYATGPGVAVPLETLRDAAACARQGIVVRSPDAFDRLAGVGEVFVDDDPALLSTGLEVVDVRPERGLPESSLLRYAASAYRHLADDRADALVDFCRDHRHHVLDLPAAGFDDGVTVTHDGRRVRVYEPEPRAGRAGPLAVAVNGQTVGVIRFGPSTRPRAARAVARLREVAGVRVVLLSHRDEADAAATARVLGVSDVRAGLTDETKAAFLLERRSIGRRTAFVGDCRAHPALASAAGFAVSTSAWDGTRPEETPADAVLLRPDLDLFERLHEVARNHVTRVRSVQRFVLLPNVLCVAGAFFFGVTALTVVVVSNLTTLGLYSHATGSLRPRAKPVTGRPAGELSARPVAS